MRDYRAIYQAIDELAQQADDEANVAQAAMGNRGPDIDHSLNVVFNVAKGRVQGLAQARAAVSDLQNGYRLGVQAWDPFPANV